MEKAKIEEFIQDYKKFEALAGEGIPALVSGMWLADFLGISHSCVKKWRAVGHGPKYFKRGRVVRYELTDIQEWLTNGERKPHKEFPAIY